MRISIPVTLLCLCSFPYAVGAEERTVLPHAHAHNDYVHPRPLLDALDQGFCSVEADIFLVDGQLLVGHSHAELQPHRTLDKLYLRPLQEKVRKNRGSVFADDQRFTLLVDIKSEPIATYAALREALEPYRKMLTSVVDGHSKQGAIEVIVSGNRPLKIVPQEKQRLVGLDGRLSDLNSPDPEHLYPLISDRWTSHFTWDGNGDFSSEERERLRAIVSRVHNRGSRLRFWATPDSPALWEMLLEEGVDLIGTDDLDGLRSFLQNDAR
jgi:hypothetical protein